MRKGEAVWNLTKEVRDKILEGERRGMDPLVRTQAWNYLLLSHRVDIEQDTEEDQKQCGCMTDLEEIGEEVSENLVFTVVHDIVHL